MTLIRVEKMKQYMVDAFTDKVFSGNPAAVCVLDAWPDDQLMKNIGRLQVQIEQDLSSVNCKNKLIVQSTVYIFFLIVIL